MRNTITSVMPNVREWGANYPDACSVVFQFADGSRGEVNTKKGKEAGIIAALEALIGKESEFEVKSSREYQGQMQHVIASYPGKQDGGGKRGGFDAAWRNTEQGARYEQERMDRRTALMQAVAFWAIPEGPGEASSLLAAAEDFYTWLRETAGQESRQDARRESGRPETQAQPVGGQVGQNSGQNAGSGIWPGPGQCPSCHAPEGKRHGKPCTGVRRMTMIPFAGIEDVVLTFEEQAGMQRVKTRYQRKPVEDQVVAAISR